MNTKTLLKLLANKYPAKYSEGMNPAILIYYDGSGRIVKNAGQDAYADGNVLYNFFDLDGLVEHLSEGVIPEDRPDWDIDEPSPAELEIMNRNAEILMFDLRGLE